MPEEIRITGNRTVRAARSSGYRYGPGVHEVSDAEAEDLLDHFAIEPADAADDSEDGEAEDFDAADFVDDHHSTVVSAIEAGDADGHLDAVEDAEKARDSGVRGSVSTAIADRRNELEG